MADGVFNIVKGAAVEKFRDTNAVGIVALMTANETEVDLVDHDEFNALFGAAGNTEASDASYGRKTSLTATVTVDDSNDRADLDFPDQTFTALDGAAIVKLLTGYEESAAETGRIPITHHDFAVTPDTSDVTAQFNAAGFFRAT